MKISAVILLLIFSIAFANCGKIETFSNLTRQKIETENAENEQPDVPPILEITQDAKGKGNVGEKTLFFNLYENGIIEFEFAGEKKINQAGEANPLKRAKISNEELQKFTALLKTEDFQKTKADYEQKCCCADTTVDYKINFQDAGRQKNISLSGYCNLDQLTNPKARKIPDFPKVLSDLLILVDNARRKYTSE